MKVLKSIIVGKIKKKTIYKKDNEKGYFLKNFRIFQIKELIKKIKAT